MQGGIGDEMSSGGIGSDFFRADASIADAGSVILLSGTSSALIDATDFVFA